MDDYRLGEPDVSTPSSQHNESITRIIDSLSDKPGALLPILHAITDELGYIPLDQLPVIASALNLSRAEIHGVISFYDYFRTTRPGKNRLQLCRAESCQAMGSRTLESSIKRKLGIDFHQTSSDGLITLEPVYCLGNCACSPCIRVNDDVLGNVDEVLVDKLLDELATQVVEIK